MELIREELIPHGIFREHRILSLEKEVNSLYRTLDKYKQMIFELTNEMEEKKVNILKR